MSAAAGSGSATDGPAFTAQFPYSGPQHDRQKLLRASLASSCLRGEMRVWQFMAGVRGAEVRRQPCVWRRRLLHAGVFHRVSREPSLCGEELERPMRIMDYSALVAALRHGHTAMAEWCMIGPLPAFDRGMYHEWLGGHLLVRAPLPILMRSACAIGWDWGRRRIEQLVAESDDPEAVGMRESGEYAVALAAACAGAGSPISLQWAESFAADAGEKGRSNVVADVSLDPDVAETCTLGVAEWLWQEERSKLSGLVFNAAAQGNWPVMEWLVQTGSVDPGTCNCFAAAARHDSVGAMRFLYDHGLDKGCESTCDEEAGSFAASYGGLSVLEWLWSQKPECVTSHCVEGAAESGDVGKVRFLLERCGLEWTDDAALGAAACGRVCVLEWALKHGLAMPHRLRRHNWDMLFASSVVHFLLAHARNFECYVGDIAKACREDLRVVEALHARFPDVLSQDMEGRCLDSAAAAGRMDVAEFILRHVEAPVCTEGALAKACAANHLELAQLLHGRFPALALSSEAMQDACVGGALEVVEWLHTEHGVAPDPDSAISAGHLRVLEFFVQHCGVSGPKDAHTVVRAVRRHHLHVVEYLVRRGMIDDVGCLLRTAEAISRRWPMQRFLRRHVGT